jgi:hypothetical protein
VSRVTALVVVAHGSVTPPCRGLRKRIQQMPFSPVLDDVDPLSPTLIE